MYTRRRDNKNRILHKGESQLADGRYRFKYRDYDGMTRYVYSWRLDKRDRAPAGKKDDDCLREKEQKILDNLHDQIVNKGGNMTVLQLVKKYISTKTGVRNSTQAGYQTVVNFLKNDPLGAKRIDQVKRSDAKCWMIQLQKEQHKSYSSIHSIRGVIRPAFRMALDDDLIRKNPFDFELATVVVNDSVTREAITKDEQHKLLKFIQEDKHFSRYYEGIYILFHTGLRISEFVGLTTANIDFKEHKLIVDHQLQRTSQMKYIIEDTKTSSGNRMIPMTPEVEACFRTILNNRKAVKVEPMIDGYSGFLYLDKNHMPLVALHWEKYFQHIVEKYNKIYKEQMPKVTPHVCRHTFCTNMAKSGMNPKTLQYIMGHSEIGVTMNTYTHMNFDDAKAEMKRISAG
jgi:site-specific recombinase XerD